MGTTSLGKAVDSRPWINALLLAYYGIFNTVMLYIMVFPIEKAKSPAPTGWVNLARTLDQLEDGVASLAIEAGKLAKEVGKIAEEVGCISKEVGKIAEAVERIEVLLERQVSHSLSSNARTLGNKRESENPQGQNPVKSKDAGFIEMTQRLFLEPTSTGADLVFVFPHDGNRERRVHLDILAAANPVFEAMLEPYRWERKTRLVVIEDMGYDVMEVILEHIYTGDIISDFPAFENPDLATKFATELVTAAEKYGLAKIKDFCNQNLIRICTDENSLDLLALALNHGLRKAGADICDFVKSTVQRKQREKILHGELNLQGLKENDNSGFG